MKIARTIATTFRLILQNLKYGDFQKCFFHGSYDYVGFISMKRRL